MDECRVRIEMLGGLRVTRGGRVLARFRTQKTAALLAYLALHPESAHPREVLTELFWPDAPPETGRLSLRVALNALRAQTGTNSFDLLGKRLPAAQPARRVPGTWPCGPPAATTWICPWR